MSEVLVAVNGGLILTVIAAALYGWFWVLRGLQQGKQPLVFEDRRPVPWGFVDLLLLVILFFVVLSAVIGIAKFAGWLPTELDLESLTPAQMAVSFGLFSLTTTVTWLLLLVVVRLRTRATWRDLGVRWRRFFGDIGLGLCAAPILLVPVFAIMAIFNANAKKTQHPLILLLEDNPEPRFFLFAGIAAVVVAPIVEEYVFRVFLQGWLENIAGVWSTFKPGTAVRKAYETWLLTGGRLPSVAEPAADVDATHGDPSIMPALEAATSTDTTPSDAAASSENVNPFRAPAWDSTDDDHPDADSESHGSRLHMRPAIVPILLSSLLFAAAHYGNGPDPIPLFFLALGLGYLYQRTHRIVPCITVHCFCNGISLFQLWVMFQSGAAP